MERFIAHDNAVQMLQQKDLKSSMERFIEFALACLSPSVKIFKIQYGEIYSQTFH